jgi:hypothetical protein
LENWLNGLLPAVPGLPRWLVSPLCCRRSGLSTEGQEMLVVKPGKL